MNKELKELLLIPTSLGPLVGMALIIASSTLLLLFDGEKIGLVTLLAKLGFGFMIIGGISKFLLWSYQKVKQPTK